MSNIAKVFDVMGFVTPVTLKAKLMIREVCDDESLGWDNPLPEDLRKKWIDFLRSLFELDSLRVPRSLWPEGEVKGLPSLVIFSDGSISAYGVAAYIRWELAEGGYWSRLIIAKSKISPKRIVSVPRMELCGALVGNRIKNFLMK